MAQHGILGQSVGSPLDLSYLADTVLLLRYFEVAGAVHKAIAVVKKRTGAHESAVRELSMSFGGVKVGRQLRELQGVLTGQLLHVSSREHEV
jgi:circadian clock protein KaiC